MKPKLNFEWLHACSGCEISLLNWGEPLLDLFDQVEIVHFPLLMTINMAVSWEKEHPYRCLRRI